MTDLLFDVTDRIATVTINRPLARNAFTFSMYKEVMAACDTVNADRSVRVLIFRGAGEKAFSAGTDISCFRGFETAQDALDYEAFMEKVLAGIETCRVPTIAAICGACTGGGAAIAASCDLRFATKDAMFGVPIARTLGNCLSVSNLNRFACLIAAARVAEMILTARLIGAQEGKDIGLYTRILDGRAELDIVTRQIAEDMKGLAPLTLEATKEGLRRVRLRETSIKSDDLIARCYTSRDFREGMQAFLEKRKPVWVGE